MSPASLHLLDGARPSLVVDPDSPEYQAHEAKLAALIESTLGFTRLSPEALLTPVPDLKPRVAHYPVGEARLAHCLFTPHLW